MEKINPQHGLCQLSLSSLSSCSPQPQDKIGSVLDVDNVMDVLHELIEKEENSKKNEENEVGTGTRIIHNCSQKEEVNHSIVTCYWAVREVMTQFCNEKQNMS